MPCRRGRSHFPASFLYQDRDGQAFPRQCSAMDLEVVILKTLGEHGEIADSGDLASSLHVEHLAVVGMIKSLQASEMVEVQVRKGR